MNLNFLGNKILVRSNLLANPKKTIPTECRERILPLSQSLVSMMIWFMEKSSVTMIKKSITIQGVSHLRDQVTYLICYVTTFLD